MAAAAHTPGGYDGVPQSVGQDFAAADKRAGHRDRMSASTDMPKDEGNGRRMSAKQRSHKTKSRVGA